MIDLRDKLTVFLITSGDNPNYGDCFKSLVFQNCEFSFEIIKDIAPMSAAFQQMIEKCKTPYYIQIDCDMIMYPESIKKMYEVMINQTKEAMICFLLWDVFTERRIQGVKIYNHEVFKKFPYNLNENSCEMGQLQRLKENGYSYSIIHEVLGHHSPKWSTEGIFTKMYTDIRKCIYHKNPNYMGCNLEEKCLDILKKEFNGLNFFAYMGIICGKQSDVSNINQEKDFRTSLFDYQRLAEMFPSLVKE